MLFVRDDPEGKEVSLCTSLHRSCYHASEIRWAWETADGCAGTICHECLLIVAVHWPELISLRRAAPKLPETTGLAAALSVFK